MKYRDLIPGMILKLYTHQVKSTYIYCDKGIFILLENGIGNKEVQDIIEMKTEGTRLVNSVCESRFNNRSYIWSQLLQSACTLKDYNKYYNVIIEVLFGEYDEE